MKAYFGLLTLLVATSAVLAHDLPVITSQPQSQIVVPGTNAVLSVAATGASDFQWRFNGSDIVGATSATLTISNVQLASAGYYLVVAKNPVGRVASQLAYLSVVDTAGRVPFSNLGNSHAEADYQVFVSGFPVPITNGTAQLMAGPALDQMQPIGIPRAVSNGYFNISSGRLVPSVAPGQTVYYQVNITYPYQYAPSGFWTQPSTALKLIAGGGSFPIPSSTNLYFPVWIEWPEPWISSGTPTNQIRIPGETFSLTNQFIGYTDLGIPTYQWRKDGEEIGSPSNFVGSILVTGTAILSFNDFRPTDAGVYDVVVLGNNWFIGPKIYLSVQTTGGQGQLQSPRFYGTNFVCDLIGALNRVYRIQRSTDFLAWEDILTVTNTTGTVTFTNSMLTTSAAFYRTKLLP